VIRSTLILLALSLAAAAATHWLHPRAPAWHLSAEPLSEAEVSIASIAQQWQNQVLWIDARSQERYNTAHIPGALLLNEQSFDQHLFDHIETLQNNSKPVVVYCDAQKCQASKAIRQALITRMGLQNVWLLHGGWPAWQQSHPSSSP
jgi:3-mercaptopyruvate sulfurtransferase SseA